MLFQKNRQTSAMCTCKKGREESAMLCFPLTDVNTRYFFGSWIGNSTRTFCIVFLVVRVGYWFLLGSFLCVCM